MLAAWEAFPTLHPLVVHAPVMLIPLAPLLFLIGWGTRSPALERTGMALLAAGFLGAVLASRVFHPHTGAMTLLAREALEHHEFWADWTQGLAGAALLPALSLSILRGHRFRGALKFLFAGLALAAAGAVTVAGHQGAALTHVHRVEIEPEAE